MTTQISSNNIQAATLATLGSGPTVTNVQITDSSYNVLDDTAVGTSGGYIKITGTNFASGCSVIINSTNATSVTFVSSTVLNVQVPAMAAGTYIVYVVNSDGGIAIRVNGLTYSGTPSWVTGSTLPQSVVGTAISIQLSATSDSTITYALQAGSSLPTGLTLSSSGLLSGTITGLSAETTYNFTITATDVELQDSPRSFSITITVGDTYWNYVSTLLSASSPTTLPFNDDASTNNFAVTVNGDTRPNNFNPYTPGYYSAYFDGTGDYLTAATIPSFGSGDFTIEGWVYNTGSVTNSGIFQLNTTAFGGLAGIALAFYTAGGGITIYHGSGSQTNVTITLSTNTWYHFALSRSGTSLKVFINGAVISTITDSTNYALTTVTLGGIYSSSYLLTGYISNFRIVNGTAVYTSAFTPSTSPLAAISGTSLLTCQSNTFVDNSTNNFTITRAGDTRISGFGPYTPNSSYSGYGSTYFDGSGDYITVASSSSFAMAGDFTMEGWVFPQTQVKSFPVVFALQTVPISVQYNHTSAPGKFSLVVGATRISGSETQAVNTWYHVAVVRSGSTITLYINGIAVASTTNATAFGTSVVAIGGYDPTSTDLAYTGYVSNVRIVNGTAVYTSAFTPPTTPLTAISGTSLLTCQSNQPVNNNVFLDNSTNNFAITRNGNVTQGTFSPYGENWSNYFDGSGDYLTLPSNTAFAFGTGAYTMEGWIYVVSAPTYVSTLFDAGGATNAISLGVSAAGAVSIGKYGIGTVLTSSSGDVPAGQWVHVAAVRASTASNDTKLYVNGVLKATGTDNNNWTVTTTPTVGGINVSGYITNGYISNLRIVKGTALYTSNFTPSTTPLQPVTKTSLLTCQSSNIKDNSANNFTITKNGDVSVQKFGPFAGTTLPTPYYGASFNGSSDYLTVGSTNQNLSADFTIEAWVYQTAQNTFEMICGDGPNYFAITATNTFGLAIGPGPTYIDIAIGSAFPLNQWVHIALCRSGTNLRAFVNGTQIGTTQTNSGAFFNYSSLKIGQQGQANYWYYHGYISNFRIVKGQALYTSDFTPSTSPLTTTSQGATASNVSVLTCQSNTFIDNSTNNYAITAATTTVKPTTYNPFTVTYSAKQSYTPAVYGGSMYFDGSDTVSLNSGTSVFAAASEDFTIEAWVYSTNLGAINMICGWNKSGFDYFNIDASGVGLNLNNTYPTGLSFSFKTNQWYHVAVSRQSNNLKAFVNGVQVGSTVSNSNSFGGSNITMSIGNWQTTPVYYMNGYISDFRFIKGQALYTSNFVPGNAPLTAVKNTALLLNGTSAGIYDSSTNAIFETVGDAKLSTSTVKFAGSTSMYFDGTGDYLAAPPPSSCMSGELGTGDFTIEYWMNASAAGTYVTVVGTQSIAGNTTAGIWRAGNRYNGASGIYFNYTNGGSFVDLTFSTTNYNDGTWHHVAFVRSSGSLKAYVDGTQVGSAQSVTQSLSSGQRMYVGYNVQDNAYYTGYISDLRITKGVARYTTNFTPATTPFTPK